MPAPTVVAERAHVFPATPQRLVEGSNRSDRSHLVAFLDELEDRHVDTRDPSDRLREVRRDLGWGRQNQGFEIAAFEADQQRQKPATRVTHQRHTRGIDILKALDRVNGSTKLALVVRDVLRARVALEFTDWNDCEEAIGGERFANAFPTELSRPFERRPIRDSAVIPHDSRKWSPSFRTTADGVRLLATPDGILLCLQGTSGGAMYNE